MKLKRLVVPGILLTLFLNLAFLSPAQEPLDYSKETARPSQDWIRDAVIYEIFPRQYSKKGNFDSITNDLGRLKKLGVTVLWLMPIHPIGELKKKGTIGSPYAVRDYYAINPRYGSKEDLKRLIKKAQGLGLKVIIDIVANHTAWDSVMMNNKSFYTVKSGRIVSPVPDWADVADLNYRNPELRRYMIEVLKYWIREYDLDGFRCDVAGFVPTGFWEEARSEVDKIKKDTLWLAEWHEPDLLVNAFNLDYSWPLHSALDEVLQGRTAVKRIRDVWEQEKAAFPKGSLHMRFTDNHDETRAVVRFGQRAALAAQAFVFTMDGVPMLYNGMEVGDSTESGAPALFERMPIFWDVGIRRPEFYRFYESMIKLRADSVALRRGDVVWLDSGDENVVMFSRRHVKEAILVLVNFSSFPAVVESPFRKLGTKVRKPGFKGKGSALKELTPEIYGNQYGRKNRSVPGGPVNLSAWEFRIFRIDGPKPDRKRPEMRDAKKVKIMRKKTREPYE